MRSVNGGIGMTSQRTRERMVERLREAGIHEPRVLDAVRSVPRHLFVDEALASRAYEDIALPIGHGQTISQPFIVALMTQTLLRGLDPGRVLEIGTGCGYQTAVLSRVAEQVFTVERVYELYRQARDRLFDLKFRNVRCLHHDGFDGWQEHAPYDAIISTAAPTVVPQSLLDQVVVGGRIVMPVGERNQQRLLCIQRTAERFEISEMDSVKFVPLVSGKV